MWGQRFMIPLKLQSQIKRELHSGHFGSESHEGPWQGRVMA
jgi:hypothetical protein